LKFDNVAKDTKSAMNSALITYLHYQQKKNRRSEKQQVVAIEQTAKEGRELQQAMLVNSR
jgi:hypothetical protein